MNWICESLFLLLFFAAVSVSQQIVDSAVGKLIRPPLPPLTDHAKLARYVIHYLEWGALSHISFQPASRGYPMSRMVSFSDGTLSNSSGTPYVYVTELDDGARDLLTHDPRSSITVSMTESKYCEEKHLDPEDPRCLQVIITGPFSRVSNTTDEYKWAKKALFSRHPQMDYWPKSHQFFVGKVTVESVLLVDGFGGNIYPSVEDYFKANPIPPEPYDNNVSS